MSSHDETSDPTWMGRPEQPQTRGYEAAVSAVTEAILNCYMREGGHWRPLPAAEVPQLTEEGDEFIAVIPFPEERTAIIAGVRHLSPTHRHRFRTPATLAVAGGKPWPVSIDTLMSMLADDLGETHMGDEITAAHLRGPDPTFLLSRIRQSVAAVAAFLDARADEIDELWSADPLSFIGSEQAGLLGHMAHPTPKSRWGMEPKQSEAYAPEAQPRFKLRWLAVDPAIVEHDSAAESGAAQLTERLLREDPAVDGAALDAALDGLGPRVLLPVHPWEFEHLRERQPLAGLIEQGLIVDLGELGSEVTPTTSLRTVYNADWPWQLTFSLHVHLSDEMRLTPTRELQDAVAAARLMDAQTGAAAAEVAPHLSLLQDPAYLALRHEGAPIEGLSVQLRENRWRTGSDADVSTVEVLVQDHPFGGSSRLGQLVARLASDTGRLPEDIAREWFARFADVAVVPVLRLYAQLGLSLETDQQDTLLELEGGWPVRCVLRDAHGVIQGQAPHDEIAGSGPGIGEGPFLDNALSVINALGVAGAVEEIVLLGDLKALLERERERGGRATALLDRLLNDPTWPCKAHMRTRLHNDVDRYVQIPNPLHGVRD